MFRKVMLSGLVLPVFSSTMTFSLDVYRRGRVLSHYWNDNDYWRARKASRWVHLLDFLLRLAIELVLIAMYILPMLYFPVSLFMVLPYKITAYCLFTFVDYVVIPELVFSGLAAVFMAVIAKLQDNDPAVELNHNVEAGVIANNSDVRSPGFVWLLILVDWLLSPLKSGHVSDMNKSEHLYRSGLFGNGVFPQAFTNMEVITAHENEHTEAMLARMQ